MQCDDTAQGSDLAVWAMLYRPEFHRWQSGAKAAPRTDRRAILKPRSSDGQGRFDIVGITVDVLPSLHGALVAQLQQAGFERKDEPSGTRLRGHGWQLILRAVDRAPGLVALNLLTDAPPARTLSLGTTLIRKNQPRTVSWRFGLQRAE